MNGQRVQIPHPIKARQYKISMIAQELNYIPEMSVEEFLFLGDEPLNRIRGIDWRRIRKSTLDLLRQEGLPYAPDTKLKDLSVSDIQMIEILKAVSTHESNIIIMDEPTSAITEKEVVILFNKIAELKAKGAGIIYISHRLDEPAQFRLTGGGANSAAWRQILADVFDTEVVRVKWDEGGAFGAALLALAVDQQHKGMSTSLREVCDQYVELDLSKSARPAAPGSSSYRELYEEFCEMLSVEFFNDV